MVEGAPRIIPEVLADNLEQWETLLLDFSERFTKEVQPNDRLSILTALRDRLNETLAETTRLALPIPNRDTPISRLPSEVFLRICELACPRTTHRSVINVIILSHVCRHWRDSLLSYPIIWSHIYLRRDSPDSLITTLLQRSHGVPLTVDIQYYSDRPMQVTCDCSHEHTRKDGDCCPHTLQHMSSLNLLEPLRANIHTLSVRYLRNGSFNPGNMEDILNTPFFSKPLPNLESLHWSCRHFGRTFGPTRLSQEPFGSSLPRLQRLSMVDCWGLLLTDTPVLKVMSMEGISRANDTGIPVDQLVRSLRRRQSLVSLSLINPVIVPNATDPPSPVSMRDLKEITLRNVDNGIASRYIRCPSIGTVTTLRIAPLDGGLWTHGWWATITATDGSGGSVSTSTRLDENLALRTTWEALAGGFVHQVIALEVEGLYLIMTINSTALPNLIHGLPDLNTVRVQLHAVGDDCRTLRNSLPGGRGIAQVERLVEKMESPDEMRRNNELWEALRVNDQIRDLLV